MVSAFSAHAQNVDELIRRAYIKFNEKDYQGAASDIDEVIQLKKAEQNELAWHVRGFVYKDIYINEDQGSPQSEARDIAVFSLMRSLELDIEKVLVDNNSKALKYLAASFFNDASDIIEERDPATIDYAESYFLKYKEIMDKIEKGINLDDKTSRFLLAMATAHRKIYEQDRDANSVHYDITKSYYRRVLEFDPENFSANYSLAVLHYNSAAYQLEKLSELDIHDMIRIQGESMRSIQFALPFMMKAYEVSPERIEAVKGLKIILFNLHDYEKSEFFEEEYQRLEKDKSRQ
jgi:hypothetical protein